LPVSKQIDGSESGIAAKDPVSRGCGAFGAVICRTLGKIRRIDAHFGFFTTVSSILKGFTAATE
jgi:hypothetical protein